MEREGFFEVSSDDAFQRISSSTPLFRGGILIYIVTGTTSLLSRFRILVAWGGCRRDPLFRGRFLRRGLIHQKRRVFVGNRLDLFKNFGQVGGQYLVWNKTMRGTCFIHAFLKGSDRLDLDGMVGFKGEQVLHCV